MKNKTDTNGIDEAEPYIELFDALRGRVGDDQVALAIMAEMARDRRMSIIQAERQSRLEDFESGPGEQANEQPGERPNPKNRAASAKQVDYLRKLGITPIVNMSSFEASQAIDEALARRRASE